MNTSLPQIQFCHAGVNVGFFTGHAEIVALNMQKIVQLCPFSKALKPKLKVVVGETGSASHSE